MGIGPGGSDLSHFFQSGKSTGAGPAPYGDSVKPQTANAVGTGLME